jgi:hypothetical protein
MFGDSHTGLLHKVAPPALDVEVGLEFFERFYQVGTVEISRGFPRNDVKSFTHLSRAKVNDAPSRLSASE